MTGKRRLIKSIVLISFCICTKLYAQTYGLVLSGGGGKGGYEVGVWKALVEYGIAQKTVVISGTSVGGLNAALFAVCPSEKAEDIWLNEVHVELNKDEELISQAGLMDIMKRLSFYGLHEKNTSAPDVYVTCSRSWKDSVGFLDGLVQFGKSITNGIFDYAYRFCLNEETSENEIRQKLLATSAFPVLTSPVRLSDGYLYSDGGAADNTPVEPVTAYDVDVILVVHLSTSPKRQEGRWGNIKVVDIVPTREMRWIDGMLDFSQAWAEDNINLGYSDTVKILKSMGLRPVDDYWFY